MILKMPRLGVPRLTFHPSLVAPLPPPQPPPHHNHTLARPLVMHDPAENKPSPQQNDSTNKLDNEKKLSTTPETILETKKTEKSTDKVIRQKPTGAAVDMAETASNDNTSKNKSVESTNEASDCVGVSSEAKTTKDGDGDAEMKEASGTETAAAPQLTKEAGGPEPMDVDTNNNSGDEKKKNSAVTGESGVSVASAGVSSEAPKEAAESNAGAGLLLLAEKAKATEDSVAGKTNDAKEKNGGDEKSVEKTAENAPVDDEKKEGAAQAMETDDNKKQDSNATEKSPCVDKAKADNPASGTDSPAVTVSATSAAATSTPAAAPAPSATTSASAAPATPSAPAPPVLRGTLSYNIDMKRHVIRGMWNYENSTAFPPQRFELVRNMEKDEDPKVLPKDGEFHGSFSLAYYHTTSKGKQKERSKVIPESGVNIKFTKIIGKENEYKVDGQGTNQFGVFNINGTAKPSPHEGSDKSFDIELRKRYVPSEVPVAPPAAAEGEQSSSSKKNKKRKHTEVEGDASTQDDKIKDEPEGGPLPPPSQSFPSNVVCLRGKIYREEADDIGLAEVVHRISGMWSSGLDLILADPQNVRGLCNRFEYEHKSTLPNDRFPVSGRYSGWFDLSNQDGTRTRISEKDVTLKFRKNSDGYYNVEGRGSNAFGKYNITGTLTQDNVITIFRHFQQRKAKKNKDSTPKVTSAPGPLHGSGQTKVAAAPPPEPKLKLEDVSVPSDGDDPDKLEAITPPAHGTYSAISRGVLRLDEDGAVVCSGKWAMTREHFNNNQVSAFSFRLEAHFAAEAVAAMKKRDGEKSEESKKDGSAAEGGASASTAAPPATKTFPIDSAMYKGSFQMRRGASKTTKIIDQQIVLKFRKNSTGSFNVYGKGTNKIGEFNLMGTLILHGKTSGHVELYRIYPVPTPPPGQPAGAPGKTAPAKTGSHPKLPTKENAASKDKSTTGIVPSAATMIPKPRPGLQRRESSRLVKLPSRLEDDDPQAQLSRIMERCSQVLQYIHEKDVAHGAFFREPVDPVALGIPTYHQVIKEPMDLGTVQRKMDKGEITTPEEFGRLVRLIFENAMTFNVDPGHAVHQAGRNLLILFNQKFRDLERTVGQIRRTYKPSEAELKRKEKEEAKKLKRKAKEEKKQRSAKKIRLDEAQAMAAANASSMAAVVAAAPTNSAPGGSITRAEFNMLLQVIQQLQGQIVQTHTLLANLSSSKEPDDTGSVSASLMSEGDSVFVPPTEVSASRPSAGKAKAKKKAETAAKATKAAIEEQKPLTLKEQEALTETISNLDSQECLEGVIKIIRESSTYINADDEEIDLEIDQLDTGTQRKLQRYVLQVRLARHPAKSSFVSKVRLDVTFTDRYH